MKYLIDYDQPLGSNYQPIIDELARLGARHKQLSLWELDSTDYASAIGAHLLRFLAPQSKLQVAEITYNRFEYPQARGLGLLGLPDPAEAFANAFAALR